MSPDPAPLYFEGTERFPRGEARRVHDAVRGYIDAGEDTLDAMIRLCRENDLLCFASLRMNRAPNPVYDEGRPLSQYDQLKPYRIYEKPGTRGKHLSYAFPEMRRHALGLFEEMVERGPDGILAEFTRVPPYVGYHPTLVRRFRERYRLQGGEPLTELMRGLRAASNSHRRRTGRRIRVAAHVFHERLMEDCAIDIDTWIDEGLIDVLVVSSKLAFMDLTPWHIPAFAKKAQAKGITLFCQIDSHYGGHDPTPEEERRRARGEKVRTEAGRVTDHYYRLTASEFYRQGTDGVLVWDGFFNGEHSVNP